MIFLDTGSFLARYLARDQHHKSSLKTWRKLEKANQRCCTTNFVLDELLTLLARRASYAFAAERGRALYTSGILSVLRPEKSDELAALDLFEKYSDQEVSFTDCISFTLMRKHRLKEAFTFDRHFKLAGFQTIGAE
ncbi:MAG: type II toxin-antitoxin system VapC family toxin [Myxococcaceae bacterium]